MNERTNEQEKGRKVSTEGGREGGPNYAAIFYLLERAEIGRYRMPQRMIAAGKTFALNVINIKRLPGNASSVYQSLIITLYLTVNSSFTG